MGGVLVMATVPGLGVEADRLMAERLGFADGSIAGCRFRLSGPLEGGEGRRLVTYWESREAYEAWRDELLAPALQAAGHPVPSIIDIWPVDHELGLI